MSVVSKNFKTAAVGAVFGGSLLLTAGMGIAGAEPLPTPASDGVLVVQNVNTIDPAEEPAAPVPSGSEFSGNDLSGAGAAEPLPEDGWIGSPAADESIGATWDPI